MFKIYFRTGIRNLLRYRSFSLINLIGLALGLSGIMMLTVMLYQYLTTNGQLIALYTRQRVKEIGIRKVLGASPFSIVRLLSRNFLILVTIALLIAAPLVWMVMHRWLEDFADRIAIQWWMLLGAGFIAMAIALVTVTFHAVRAALANPVDSLRSE